MIARDLIDYDSAMPHASPDFLVFEVSRALPYERFVEDLDDSAVLPRLRSGTLQAVIAVSVDVIGGTSGVVQLAIARHELARFGRRLLASARLASPSEATRELELRYLNRASNRRLVLRADDPDETFVRAVFELIAADGDGRLGDASN